MSLNWLLPGLVLCITANPALADWAGHIKGLGQAQDSDALAATDLRLKNQQTHQAWSFKLDYQLQAAASDGLGNLPIPNDDAQVMNLQHTLLNQQDVIAQHRIDRLSVSYAQNQYSVNLGRQAFSWGQGMIFNPLDLFNPFAPTAFDKEYKPGSDMLHAQYLMDSGDDLGLLAVPRRNTQTGDIETDQTSYAVFWRHFAQIETHVMLAKDYNDTVLGLSFSGNWRDGQWNLELMPTQLESGDIKTSALINYHQAWSWWERNVSGYIEGFYNSFGEQKAKPTTLSNELAVRLARGQLFTKNQYYLGLGGSMEITALSSANLTSLANLQDRSGLVMLNTTYSLSNTQQLLLGLQQALGANNTEFESTTQAYIQWA
ncbi:MAG: hypothetical protein IBX48_00890, partial [Thiomicrospira sp.]|uniref:hypothetical protein n=1 Tax=Thiomicrospira sp. TaxID=935 RepID=UPI0019DD7A66